ncbi:hypothetical protein [Luteolibacter sp. LG18]|uniref:hypothetical protein n=1 Tax=Luteolibacter sp. LG18 TaxID=2819286 RepID=UPI002B2FDA91|nr:hypothetical protein llg_29290 [Luteolibacter sp. LG18]
MTFIGTWRSGADPARQLVDFIAENGGNPGYDGRLLGMAGTGDEVEVVEHAWGDGDPWEVLLRLFRDEGWNLLHCRFVIQGVERYYALSPSNSRLELTILANREVLADGTLDFNWHYSHWKPRVARLMNVEAARGTADERGGRGVSGRGVGRDAGSRPGRGFS